MPRAPAWSQRRTVARPAQLCCSMPTTGPTTDCAGAGPELLGRPARRRRPGLAPRAAYHSGIGVLALADVDHAPSQPAPTLWPTEFTACSTPWTRHHRSTAARGLEPCATIIVRCPRHGVRLGRSPSLTAGKEVVCMVTSGEAGIDGMRTVPTRRPKIESALDRGVDSSGCPTHLGAACRCGATRGRPPALPDRAHRQLRDLRQPQLNQADHRHRPSGARRGARASSRWVFPEQLVDGDSRGEVQAVWRLSAGERHDDTFDKGGSPPRGVHRGWGGRTGIPASSSRASASRPDAWAWRSPPPEVYPMGGEADAGDHLRPRHLARRLSPDPTKRRDPARRRW